MKVLRLRPHTYQTRKSTKEVVIRSKYMGGTPDYWYQAVLIDATKSKDEIFTAIDTDTSHGKECLACSCDSCKCKSQCACVDCHDCERCGNVCVNICHQYQGSVLMDAVGSAGFSFFGVFFVELKSVLIYPEYRQKGHSKSLITLLEKAAVKQGGHALTSVSTVRCENTSMCKSFISLQYRLLHSIARNEGAVNVYAKLIS